MKTAMQLLLEKFDRMPEYLFATYLKVNRDGLLEKEKEQIKDAWDAGMSEGIGTTMASLDFDGEFINYYNETYKNDTNNISSN